MRDDSNLRAVTGLTSQRLDLDDPLLDLGYLHSKKLAHQVRVSARDNDLRATGFLAHGHDVHTDTTPMGIFLPGNLFRRRHNALQ